MSVAGQEKFRSLTSSYYRGTEGIILVYDVTNRPSFDSISMWLREVETYSTSRDTVKLLVGNKIDKVCECVGQTVSERWSDHTLLYSTLLHSTPLHSTPLYSTLLLFWL
jgi:small GTP-binding protein